jgi:hypothetical protein
MRNLSRADRFLEADPSGHFAATQRLTEVNGPMSKVNDDLRIAADARTHLVGIGNLVVPDRVDLETGP